MQHTIEAYFKNKIIDFRIYEIAHKGVIRTVDTARIVRLIKNLRGKDRTIMGRFLFAMEYKTDIHEVFKELAKGYVKKHF